MGYGIIVRIRGPYALFTRPEMKVERVSYEVITPSAARGIIEAVYWKPAIRWVIDQIHVMSEITFTNVRRNEVSMKVPESEVLQRMNGGTEPFYLNSTDSRQQRAAMVLRNVDYVVEAHFELTDRAGQEDSVEKHYNMVLRRLRNGQYYSAPCLGTREFPAQVEVIENKNLIPVSPLTGQKSLGWMLYDLDFSNPADIQPLFFYAEMNNGVLDLRNVEVRS